MLKSKFVLKHIVILALGVFISFCADAQEFKAGFQFGMTGTQVRGDGISGFNKAGLFGGFFVNRPTGKIGEFQLELNFIQKGSRKNNDPEQGIYDKYLLRLNYIELPFSYRFNLTKKIKLEGGLMIAYLITSKEFDENGEIIPDLTVDYFNDFDFSIMAGINYKLSKKLSINFRYSYSILPIRGTPKIDTNRWTKGQYNSVLCTALQYNFN